jgi:hypothetical protein
VSVRELFGYYSVVAGGGGLSHSLVGDPSPKVVVSAASTLAFMLGNAKPYLAQAQHRYNYHCQDHFHPSFYEYDRSKTFYNFTIIQNFVTNVIS